MDSRRHPDRYLRRHHGQQPDTDSPAVHVKRFWDPNEHRDLGDLDLCPVDGGFHAHIRLGRRPIRISPDIYRGDGRVCAFLIRRRTGPGFRMVDCFSGCPGNLQRHDTSLGHGDFEPGFSGSPAGKGYGRLGRGQRCCPWHGSGNQRFSGPFIRLAGDFFCSTAP